MTFRKTVLAYLTGWLIVQPLYNRLIKLWRKRELENPSEETSAYFRVQAQAVVDELQRRSDIIWTGEQVRTIATQAAGAATAPFMQAFPDFVFPDRDVLEGVNRVLIDHGVPHVEFR